MNLYTSYWRNPLLGQVEAEKVSISRGDARFPVTFSYGKLWALCPSKATFALADDLDFEQAYLAGLEEVGPEHIGRALQRLSEEAGGLPLVLLCHERDHECCHRSMFARWWQAQTGEHVPELTAGLLPEKGGTEEQRLF